MMLMCPLHARRHAAHHTAAGESDQDIWPSVDYLRSQGVGAILDYAAEDDVGAGSDSDDDDEAGKQQGSSTGATDSSPSASAADSSGAAHMPKQQQVAGVTPLAVPRLPRTGE
jgi:hypothetical protein